MTTERARRREIYSFENHNQYDFKHIESVFGKNIYDYIVSYIKPDKLKSISNGETDPVECFLRNIPQYPHYLEKYVKYSNVLLISNEPGLTNVSNIYGCLHANNKLIEQEIISSFFYQSMLSWLSQTNYLGNVNGERKNENKIVGKFNKLGKLAYFFDERIDKDIINSKNKCLHIDIFPFPQKDKNDNNERNKKNDIVNIIIKNENFDKSDPLLFPFFCHENNKNLINLFCSNSSEINKYICFIGNRSIYPVNKPFLSNNYIKTKDNRLFMYDLLKDVPCNVEIRAVATWPNNLKNHTIYKRNNINKNKNRIDFEIYAYHPSPKRGTSS